MNIASPCRAVWYCVESEAYWESRGILMEDISSATQHVVYRAQAAAKDWVAILARLGYAIMSCASVKGDG
jgi:hypothetical protein